jgi:cobalt-zinc-cadmium efflux system protein
MHRETGQNAKRALMLALILNGGFLVIEAVAGFVTGSLALLSDAAHMVSDVVALALALVATWVANRAANPTRSFGWRRAEPLAAFVNAASLLVVVVVIVKEAIERLMSEPPALNAPVILAVGAVGLAINLGSAWFLYRSAESNMNVRGALAHMLADALGSIGAMIAAFGLWLGFPAIDAIVSVAIAVLVLVGTWRLLRDSTATLMQFAPRKVSPQAVHEALEKLDGVIGVHDLHVWSLDDDNTILTGHLVTNAEDGGAEIRCLAEQLLKESFDVHHTTLQMERPDECEHPGCVLEQGRND